MHPTIVLRLHPATVVVVVVVVVATIECSQCPMHPTIPLHPVIVTSDPMTEVLCIRHRITPTF